MHSNGRHTESSEQEHRDDGVEDRKPSNLQVLLCVLDYVSSAREVRFDPPAAHASASE